MVAYSDRDAVMVNNVTEEPEAVAVPASDESIKDLLAKGRRDYIAGNFENAVELLGQALEEGTKKHGEFSPEIFTIYLYYGKSLLEVARTEDGLLQSGAIENAAPTAEQSSGDAEMKEETERTEDTEKTEETVAEEESAPEDPKASEEKPTEESKSEETVEEPEKVPVEESEKVPVEGSEKVSVEESEKAAVEEKKESTEQQEETTEEKTETSEEKDESTATAREEEDSEAEGDEEDVPVIENAWEVLEIARSICEKQGSSQEWDLKKADVLHSLGECSIENENHTQAVEDINACIEIYTQYLEPFDRLIAQAFVTMARAYKMNSDYEQAKNFYEKAQKTLNMRAEHLASSLESETDEKKKSELTKEREDLLEIVKDIGLNIEDAVESGKQIEEKMDKIRERIGLKTGNVLSEITDKPAVDITQTIRRKRPAEETTTEETNKRTKE